jgi:tungstate transport system substrate-binding protein
MKRPLVAAVVALLTATSLQAEEMKLAVTTSFHNSGLSDVLLPEITKDTGLTVHLLVVGTGQAIRLGEAGDVDAILVHSRKAEEAFIAGGYGIHRTEIMYNDFVLIGPKSDPANINAAPDVTNALTAIKSSESAFVSRGDDSGTHKKELSLWKAANHAPSEFSASWYRSTGSGMGAALNTASGMDAYIMSDRASWLNFGNKGDLALLFSGDPVLFNQYAYLPVNSQKHPHVNKAAVAKLEAWLTSDQAKSLINGYTLKGEALFTYNAK